MFLGTKIYVHSLVLAALLLGMGLAAWFSPRISKLGQQRQLHIVGFVLLGALISSGLGMGLLPGIVETIINFEVPSKKVLQPNAVAFLILVALIPSLLLGLCFPLSFSLVQKNARGAWQKTHALTRALYLNTVMAVLGSLLTTYFLFSFFGTVNVLKLFLAGFAFFALLAFGLAQARFWQRILCSVVVIAVSFPILTKKISLHPSLPVMWQTEDEYGYLSILRIHDREDQVAPRWTMFHNYTNIVGAYGQAETVFVQHNLALFPALLAAQRKDVLVIGMGYGLTSEAFTFIPEVEKITSVELVPSVLVAQDKMEFKDNSYLRDPRLHNVVDDGRSYLAQARQKWDIISVNVDPYGAGVTTLFSVEFYNLVLQKLNRGGVYSQLLFGADRDLAHMLKTAQTVFPHERKMTGYNEDGFILLASVEPMPEWTSEEVKKLISRMGKLMPGTASDGSVLSSGPQLYAEQEKAEQFSIEARKEHAQLIYDSNLKVETSRSSFWDLFLHYPNDYF